MDSSDDTNLSPVTLNAIMDTLSSLGEKMDNNFKKLRDEMEIFKQDLKAEVQVLSSVVIFVVVSVCNIVSIVFSFSFVACFVL